MSDVNCTDLNNDIIVTGSKDERIIVSPFDAESCDNIKPRHVINLNDRVLSTSLSNSSNKLAVGTAGYGISPLDIYDINK